MKKLLIIIGGVIVLLVLLGVWLYMLLYNQPNQENDGLFANFNLFGDQAIAPVPLPPAEPGANIEVNVSASKLRQLTTRPVIGFTEVYSSSTEPHYVTYAEAGTGHLYQINMKTGEEERISNTTIPNASRAAISPDGQTIAMRSGFTANSIVVYGNLNASGGFDNRTLANGIADMKFTLAGNLLYSEPTTTGLRARELNRETQAVSTLFEIPFRAAEIIWGQANDASHYVYTKPNSQLRSYVYEVIGGQFIRQPIAGEGITVSANANFVVYNQLFTTEHAGFVYDKVLNTQTPTPILPVADKCAFFSHTSSLIYCGYDITVYDYEFPDSWYKGTESFSDRIWEIDLRSGAAKQLVAPLQVSGREIDIIDMTASQNTPMLYFINKHDNTLWSYER